MPFITICLYFTVSTVFENIYKLSNKDMNESSSSILNHYDLHF